MKKILSVFGTHPKTIKMAPLVHANPQSSDIESRVCVAGQHRSTLGDVFLCGFHFITKTASRWMFVLPTFRLLMQKLFGHFYATIDKLALFCLMIFSCAAGRAEMPSTAFFYGNPVPVDTLSQFERVVVEADNLDDLAGLSASGTMVFAYLSVGEAEGWRAITRELDPGWFLGDNPAWLSRIADLTQPGWRDFLIEQRMAFLWERGYRGFFLDTLDSYQIAVKDPAAQAAQVHALADIIRSMHRRFPGVKLLFNRGFEVLPEVGNLAVGLVAESLFQGWNAATQSYVEVEESGRIWLLGRLRDANTLYGLPITVIDYVPPQKQVLARNTAMRIAALGFTPWVANPSLDTIGFGANK